MEVEFLLATAMVLAFGVYLVERLSYSKRVYLEVQAELAKAKEAMAGELAALSKQVDAQRERLNKVEIRR
jgi:hypothetical protein